MSDSDFKIKNGILTEYKCKGGSAFCGRENLIIHGKAGSYAEQFAKKNKIPFEALHFERCFSLL